MEASCGEADFDPNLVFETETGNLRRSNKAGTADYGMGLAFTARMWQTPGTDSFRSRGGDRKDEMGLDQQARFWATPTVQDGKNTAGPSQYERNSHPLNVQSVMWATPRAEHDGGRHRGTADTLHSQVKSQWPTPQAADSERKSETMMRGNPTLLGACRLWPSPNASNGTGAGSHGTGGDNLQTAVSTHPPATTTPDGPTSSPPTRRLNPRFAEMLMGWPPGWTHPLTPLGTSACEPLAMAWSRLQPPSPGQSSSDGWRATGD